MATITIDGKTYSGNNISISNDIISIDGKSQVDLTNQPITVIKIDGVVNKLESDASVNMTGEIRGSVSAGGSVNCDNINGNVTAGGSINCDNIGGNASAGGSIRT